MQRVCPYRTRHFATACVDGSWAIHDLARVQTVRHIQAVLWNCRGLFLAAGLEQAWQELDAVCRCIEFHPDGLVVAGGMQEMLLR